MNRRPANALAPELLQGLHSALDAAESSGRVKVMIIESSLPGFFAAGADIKHLATIDAESFTAYGAEMRAVNDRLSAAGWISIAAMDGLALGGGLELALACSLRVSGPNAKFGLPEVSIGLIPGAGGTQRLPQLVGRGRALDLMLTARQVEADEALRIGLVDRVTRGNATIAAMHLTTELIAASLPAQLAVIRSVNAAFDLPMANGARFEVEQEQALFEQGEAAEGIRAFVNKEAPRFD
jgi:enoyl-CoA hydratase